jgi:hypothetical protein
MLDLLILTPHDIHQKRTAGQGHFPTAGAISTSIRFHLIDIQISYLILEALLQLNCAIVVLANLRCHSSPLFDVGSTEEESIKYDQ